MKNFIYFLSCINILTVFTINSVFGQFPEVSTYFGTGQAGFLNGDVNIATFNHPFGLSNGSQGRIFIADADNHCIRVINTQGMAETYAGIGIAGFQDGPVTQARFNSPSDIWADPMNDVVYVSDFQNQRIRKIENGIVSTVAGNGQAGYIDGPGNIAQFNYPRGIVKDPIGNLYIADSWNHRIRKIDSLGNVTTYAGGGTATGVGSIGEYVDAQGSDARFYTPSGLTIDLNGNLYVADAYNHRVRKIDLQQQVSTFAGSGPTGQGQGGFQNGPPLTARFNTPTEVRFFETFCPADAQALFIADTYNNKIRIMRADLGPWNVITYAGSGLSGFQNGTADSARFNFPRALTGWYGNATCVLMIADYNNHCIRAIQDHYTGINDLDKKSMIKIWPNPTYSYVNIQNFSPVESDLFITVTDINGKKLLFGTVGNHEPIRIDISELSAGVYLISINDKNTVIANKRFIKM